MASHLSPKDLIEEIIERIHWYEREFSLKELDERLQKIVVEMKEIREIKKNHPDRVRLICQYWRDIGEELEIDIPESVYEVENINSYEVRYKDSDVGVKLHIFDEPKIDKNIIVIIKEETKSANDIGIRSFSYWQGADFYDVYCEELDRLKDFKMKERINFFRRYLDKYRNLSLKGKEKVYEIGKVIDPIKN